MMAGAMAGGAAFSSLLPGRVVEILPGLIFTLLGAAAASDFLGAEAQSRGDLDGTL